VSRFNVFLIAQFPHSSTLRKRVNLSDTLIFTTGEHAVKAANIRRDSRICLCVDDEAPPYAYIMVEGTATLSSDLNALLHWATRIAERYMGEDLAETYGKRNGVPGELLVRVTPTRVIFEKDIAI